MVTSLEIANLFNKRHDNVKRTILRYGIKHTVKYDYYKNSLGLKNKKEIFIMDDDVLNIFGYQKLATMRCAEKVALKTIEQIKGVKLIYQYYVCEKYRIDGYDPVNNVAYEIDEEHHFTPQQMDADRVREEEIKAALGCEFVRIHV
ncbi:Rha family transcriptional regulator [Escherichia coli]|nr:Rha family transcriptional regulator [Escherichia coli]